VETNSIRRGPDKQLNKRKNVKIQHLAPQTGMPTCLLEEKRDMKKKKTKATLKGRRKLQKNTPPMRQKTPAE